MRVFVSVLGTVGTRYETYISTTVLVPRNLRWLLDFWKNCASLGYRNIACRLCQNILMLMKHNCVDACGTTCYSCIPSSTC